MLFAEDDALRVLARSMLVPVDGVAACVERMRAEIKALQGEGGRLRALLAQRIAAEAIASGEARVVLVLEEGGAELAQSVASELTREGARIAIVGARTPEGIHLVVSRGPASTENAGAIVKAIAAAAGGKGGGRPERAEGRLPATADLRAALQSS
jgi:alanyl-tRNA synthetase